MNTLSTFDVTKIASSFDWAVKTLSAFDVTKIASEFIESHAFFILFFLCAQILNLSSHNNMIGVTYLLYMFLLNGIQQFDSESFFT